MDCDKKVDEDDVLFSHCHMHTLKKNLSSPYRSQTYDFPIASSNNDCSFSRINLCH